jgi:hypothetical protein
MSSCLFCNSESFSDSPFEDTIFNNKQYEYTTCNSCKLLQLNPLPTVDDHTKMYVIDYYGFKKVLPSNEYDIILSQIKHLGDFKTILDFGNELINNLENVFYNIGRKKSS